MLKEIKAYIRPFRLEEIIRQLEEHGVPGITVLEVHPVGYGFQPNYFSTAREELKRAPEIVKLEIICRDEQVETFVGILVELASTQSRGDGRIFISPVDEVVRVRDRRRGAEVL
jgi:nitrogen regulatory protein P-II 1